MNKVKLVGLTMVLPILALSWPAFAQSLPTHVSTPVVGLTMSHTINHIGQKLLPYLVVEHGKVKLSTDNRHTLGLSVNQFKQVTSGITFANTHPITVTTTTTTPSSASLGSSANMLVRAPGGGGGGSVQITLTHTEMNFILTAGILASAAFIVAGIVVAGAATVASDGAVLVVAGVSLSMAQVYSVLGTIIGGLTSIAWIWEPQGNVTISIPDSALEFAEGTVYVWDNNNFSSVNV